MRIIGVTGGVGAGKSMVLQYLREEYKAELILADIVGHEVMEPGQRAYRKIVEDFGEKILTEEGWIDRKALGAIVFAEPEKRKRLNAIVHPEVKAEILKRLKKLEKDGAACAVVEAALFLEENYDSFCDETWYVYANEEQRRRRLKESRGYTEERVEQMFRSQMTHEEFLKRCRVVIDNNGTMQETYEQIDQRMRQ